MIPRKHAACLALLLIAFAGAGTTFAALSPTKAPHSGKPTTALEPLKRSSVIDDSIPLPSAKDLALRSDGVHKADALAHFVQGVDYEENGEMDKALEAYRQVVNVGPGEVELAVRVAALLVREDEYPDAIDVLKDAVKARPSAPEPYLSLAFIYAKYLRTTDQAIAFANKAIALDPESIDGYQRLFEIEIASGDERRALATLDRAAKVQSAAASFWIRLGRLYSSIFLKPDAHASLEQTGRLNEIYKTAAMKGQDDTAVLKEAGDYFASTEQIKDALPLYLRVLELKPEDANVREKLATAFVLTNQRSRAVETLDTIIKEHPEKYQPYELLAQLHDDEARSLARANQLETANAEFKKAAANYEQSLLI